MAERDGPSLGSRVGRFIISIPSRYWVSICVYLVPIVATSVARRALGDDPTAARIEQLGYGWPTTFEHGWAWTLFTGMFVAKSLTASFAPSFSLIAVVLLEHKASHWRTIVAFLGGQVVGVCLALLLTWPLRGHSGAFAHEMTATVDFGFSVGGFCALGMWTCYLRAPLRRPLRWGISCYLACQLLFSGLIYDISHPIGWTLGLVGGARLMAPRRLDRRPWRSPNDLLWMVLAVALGIGEGLYASWHAGGIGGIFGWGPS